MKRIAPGAYDDGEGGLHIDITEMLTANGWPDTPENRATLEREAARMARAIGAELTLSPPTQSGDT